MLKFILVGVFNTLFGSGIMFLLYNVFGFGYWISSASNYIFGSILSFFLNKYWTFNVKKWSFFMIIGFTVNIIISYLISYKIARTVIYLLFTDNSQILKDNIAFITGICLFTGLNYIGQRYIVFRKDKKKESPC